MSKMSPEFRRMFGLGFLQTPPHGDALALLLTFGSAKVILYHPIAAREVFSESSLD